MLPIAGAAEASSYTNWEFLQVLGNKALLKAARFYKIGALVKTADVEKDFLTTFVKTSKSKAN